MHFFGSKTLQHLVQTYAIDFNVPAFACGWGRKKSYQKAAHVAKEHQLPLYCLEDGFIRSIGLGVHGVPPLSIVIDDIGIHFDASQDSRLERYILENADFDSVKIQRAMDCIVQYRITKYNTPTQPLSAAWTCSSQQKVLVIDQTYGDQSIQYGAADASRFQVMLEHALQKHPDAQILLKIHPDVLAKKRKGHFDLSKLDSRVQCVTENANIYALFALVDEVYVVSSQAGFEALLAGKIVHCFGVPWYAGWGLTIDHALPDVVQQRRKEKRTLQQLFYAAYYRYSHYFHPMDRSHCELEDILELLILNLSWRDRLSGPVTAVGFSKWKQHFLNAYFADKTQNLKFLKAWRVPYSRTQKWLVWGKKYQTVFAEKHHKGHTIWRIEDGFIRSKGLGAYLIRPCSLVLDDQGIYYDATGPSRLEYLLNQCQLTDPQKQRAVNLIEQILAGQLTKYNVGIKNSHWLNAPVGQKVILVPGQVEDDASIQYGGLDIKCNLNLLKAVRLDNPEAWIVYKPHPDVQAKLRSGFIEPTGAMLYANQLIEDVSMVSCLEVVDEVHTITSLTGFEALLRGLKVYCYGLPFYAGWGLTQDRHHCTRRKRQLSLVEMVYIVLVDYAIYNVPHLPEGMSLLRPEDAIRYLEQSHDASLSTLSTQQSKALVARIRAASLASINRFKRRKTQ